MQEQKRVSASLLGGICVYNGCGIARFVMGELRFVAMAWRFFFSFLTLLTIVLCQ